MLHENVAFLPLVYHLLLIKPSQTDSFWWSFHSEIQKDRKKECARDRREKWEKVILSRIERTENESIFPTYDYPAASKATSELIAQWCLGGGGGMGGGGANSQQVHFMSTSILLFLMGMNNVSPQSLTPTDTEAYRSFTNLLSLNWVSHLLYASEVPVVLWFYRFFQV